jgi:hypothetical protein
MTNIKLTYEYTLSSIKVASESIDKLNTKLTVVLTLSGILINFGKDLPGYSTYIKCHTSQYPCITCYLLQLIAYILIALAIVTSLWGLLPTKAGKIVLPEQLLTDEWNKAEEEKYMTALIQYLEKETLLDINELGSKKGKRLNYTIISIGGAVLLLGLDKILGASVPVLENFCRNL